MPKLVPLVASGGERLFVNPLQVEAVGGTFEEDHAVIYFYWNTRSVMVQGDPDRVRALLDEGVA